MKRTDVMRDVEQKVVLYVLAVQKVIDLYLGLANNVIIKTAKIVLNLQEHAKNVLMDLLIFQEIVNPAKMKIV